MIPRRKQKGAQNRTSSSVTRNNGGNSESMVMIPSSTLSQVSNLLEYDHSMARSYHAPTIAHNDMIGSIVCQGSISQYSYVGGQSACTGICVVGAFYLLALDDLNTATKLNLESIVEEGIGMRDGSSSTHSNVDDLWNLPNLSYIVDNLTRGETRQGLIHRNNSMRDAFDEARNFAYTTHQAQNVGVVFTKSGETILCLNQVSDCAWFMFDSHGQSHEQTKAVYMKRFDTLEELVLGLQRKHPVQDFWNDTSFQAELYNMFEATPVILRSSIDRPQLSDHALERGRNNQDQSSMHGFNQLEQEIEVNRTYSAILNSNGNQKERLNSSFDLNDFMDPLTYIVMADPVVCDDGNTYDRSTIEMHFQERRRKEEERLRQKTDGNHGQEATDTSNTCCGGAQHAIELTSPMTNEVITENLIPNRILEQQIVRFMDADTGDLTIADIQEWQKRRQEKKERDKKRSEEEHRQKERHEERQRNALQAEERRLREDMDVDTTAEARPPQSFWVRIDTMPQQDLNSHNLGLSVALCRESDRAPPNLVTSEFGNLRCMVAACARSMKNPMWCARCGRLICSRCLNFSVGDITSLDSAEKHRICIDCVTQIADAMNEEDLQMAQRRTLLLRVYVKDHINYMCERAAALQSKLRRHIADEEQQPKLRQINSQIDALLESISSLEEQTKQAQRAAAAARDSLGDDLNDNCEVKRLRVRCSNLEAGLAELDRRRSNIRDEDEEDHVKYTEERSLLHHELENAHMELAIACSLRAKSEPEASEWPCERQLSELCEDLEARLTEALSTDPIESPDHTMLISSLETELERAQMELAFFRSSAVEGSSHGDGKLPQSLGVNTFAVQRERYNASAPHKSSCDSPITGKTDGKSRNETWQADFAAIDKVNFAEWPLPLGLKYPTQRMAQRDEWLQNELKSRLANLILALEEEHTQHYNFLCNHRDQLEDDVHRLQTQLHIAEVTAMEEERRLAERNERKRQEEAARKERLRKIQEQQEKAHQEAEELRNRHQREEAATVAALAEARRGGARTFGGEGDFRMCKRCKMGPVENRGCPDLKAHNDSSSSYKGAKVRSKKNPNSCPHCAWFSPHWHDWPAWDGVFGPH